ncbi:hypothetical protein Y032_0163g3458 [Ancylostoma ceylanicum]|uniref:Uncharacterized protein n=1 Tax=Ancylostoma ceylanicum TaxID=53326 RepID=A0A016SXA5_9BILA|nr:hypothetical protein Y032_0163g3458 [Ancylostoma ceylanicum]
MNVNENVSRFGLVSPLIASMPARRRSAGLSRRHIERSAIYLKISVIEGLMKKLLNIPTGIHCLFSCIRRFCYPCTHQPPDCALPSLFSSANLVASDCIP